MGVLDITTIFYSKPLLENSACALQCDRDTCDVGIVDVSKESGKHWRIIYNFPIFLHTFYPLSIGLSAVMYHHYYKDEKSPCAYLLIKLVIKLVNNWYKSRGFFLHISLSDLSKLSYFQIFDTSVYIFNLYCFLNTVCCWI